MKNYMAGLLVGMGIHTILTYIRGIDYYLANAKDAFAWYSLPLGIFILIIGLALIWRGAE